MMYEVPAIFVGQAAVQVAREVAYFENSVEVFDCKKSSKIICDVNSRIVTTPLRNSSQVPVFGTPLTWTEGLQRNSDILDTLEAFRKVLEECNNPQRLSVVSGAVGTLCPSLLESLADDYPHLSVLSVLLLPVGGTHGIECLNFIMNAVYSIHFPEGIAML
jgi:hypothetical protein